MGKEFVDEREFELINIVGQKLGSNQRDLSRHLELSLGQTNMLIRRLISKGFIHISQLNKRKVRYLLTPKGIAEQLRKSVKYTSHTINAITLIKDHVTKILQTLHSEGQRKFYVYSESDLKFLIDSAFKEVKLADSTITVLENVPNHQLDGFLLLGKENVVLGEFNKDNNIDLIEEVAKLNHFTSLKVE